MKRVSISRTHGRVTSATLYDGTVVTRRADDIIILNMDGKPTNFRTAEYLHHFCYALPDHIPGWSPMCTCGSPAVITGWNAYKRDASPTSGDKDGGLIPGQLVVCKHHVEKGKHADGLS